MRATSLGSGSVGPALFARIPNAIFIAVQERITQIVVGFARIPGIVGVGIHKALFAQSIGHDGYPAVVRSCISTFQCHAAATRQGRAGCPAIRPPLNLPAFCHEIDRGVVRHGVTQPVRSDDIQLRRRTVDIPALDVMSRNTQRKEVLGRQARRDGQGSRLAPDGRCICQRGDNPDRSGRRPGTQ